MPPAASCVDAKPADEATANAANIFLTVLYFMGSSFKTKCENPTRFGAGLQCRLVVPMYMLKNQNAPRAVERKADNNAAGIKIRVHGTLFKLARSLSYSGFRRKGVRSFVKVHEFLNFQSPQRSR